jgi:hypothetical protein
MKIPARVWTLSRSLFYCRLAFVGLLVLSGHPEAALQWGFKPALVADFPVSLLYLVSPISGPTIDAIVGPIWWFFLPIVCWLIWGRRDKSGRDAI